MFDFLINNPFILFVFICCLWPGLMFLAGTAIGSLVARRGLPRVAWPSSEGGGRNDANM
jgi:hypothetical protein